MKSNRYLQPFSLPVYLLCLCMINPRIVPAQQQQAYHCFTYYKILPGKERELRSLIETVDARVQQARVNNGTISGWYLFEVLNPSGSSAEYDYVIVTAIRGFKNIFEPSYPFDSAFKKVFAGTKSLTDYYSKLAGITRVVKQEIYSDIAVADSSSPDGFQSKYIVIDFMQPKPGMFGQYIKTEIDTFRLIHRERVKIGAISQWALLQLALPFDVKTGYSYLALNFYNDLNVMVGDARYDEGLKKTFPEVKLGDLFESASRTRDNPRAELLRRAFLILPEKK